MEMSAPKVTLAQIKAKIVAVDFLLMPDKRTTICHITLQNGYTVRGESSCVSKENFDAALGQELAQADAIDKIWPLEGYLLAEKLYQESQS